ncbi:MAG: PadR family transcriptional regulator [Spirochaetes bacterium]|nr:PadR family transcriptional regulator [Spirochaetota bacterium]
MQDKIILGYLMQRERTGYEIKKQMEMSTTYFFNTSLGCIFPAFKKLEKNRLVSVKRTVEGGRTKKTYSVTEKGKREFLAWLGDETSIAKIKDEALLKIFFFTQLPAEGRERMLRDYLEKLDGFIEHLADLRQFLIDSMPDYDYFRMTVLEFGIDYYQFIRRWFGDYLTGGGCRPAGERR